MALKTFIQSDSVGDAWRDVTGGISQIVHADDERIIVRREWGAYSVFTADWAVIAYSVRSVEAALSAQPDTR